VCIGDIYSFARESRVEMVEIGVEIVKIYYFIFILIYFYIYLYINFT